MRVAFFLDSAAGKIFCTGSLHADAQAARGRVLIVPPLAEEMNKSRHVLSGVARAAADAGHEVLLPDLFGTGDSQGDLAEATLDIWRADLDRVLGRMQEEAPLHIVAFRAGALLAADALSRHPAQSITLVHPQSDGRQVLTQLLRLRLAGGLFGDGEKETVSQLRQRLDAGEALEIAGYRLSPALAAGIDVLTLEDLPADKVSRIHWIELAPQADRPLMPASQRIIDRWRSGGSPVETSIVACDQFWATQEIAACPAVAETVIQRLAG